MKNKKQRIKDKKCIIENRKILKRYPFMDPVDWGGNRIPKKEHHYLISSYEDIPTGWRKCFGEMMLEEIREAAIRTKCLDKLMFVQIKEKYGTLRMYSYNSSNEVEDILEKYEVISANVCVKCGMPDVPMLNLYWICPYCRDCYSKIQKRSEKFGVTYPDYDTLYEPGEDVMKESYTYSRYENNEWKKYEEDISDTVKKIRMRWQR